MPFPMHSLTPCTHSRYAPLLLSLNRFLPSLPPSSLSSPPLHCLPNVFSFALFPPSRLPLPSPHSRPLPTPLLSPLPPSPHSPPLPTPPLPHFPSSRPWPLLNSPPSPAACLPLERVLAEGPGVSYALNWSLAAAGVTPAGLVQRNAKPGKLGAAALSECFYRTCFCLLTPLCSSVLLCAPLCSPPRSSAPLCAPLCPAAPICAHLRPSLCPPAAKAPARVAVKGSKDLSKADYSKLRKEGPPFLAAICVCVLDWPWVTPSPPPPAPLTLLPPLLQPCLHTDSDAFRPRPHHFHPQPPTLPLHSPFSPPSSPSGDGPPVLVAVTAHLSSLPSVFVQDGAVGSASLSHVHTRAICDPPAAAAAMAALLYPTPTHTVAPDSFPVTVYAAINVKHMYYPLCHSSSPVPIFPHPPRPPRPPFPSLHSSFCHPSLGALLCEGLIALDGDSSSLSSPALHWRTGLQSERPILGSPSLPRSTSSTPPTPFLLRFPPFPPRSNTAGEGLIALDWETSSLVVTGTAVADAASIRALLAAAAGPAALSRGALLLNASLRLSLLLLPAPLFQCSLLLLSLLPTFPLPRLIQSKPGSCLLLSPPSAAPVLPKSAAFPADSLLWSAGGVARLFPAKDGSAPSLYAKPNAVLQGAPKQAAYYFLAGYDGTSFHPSLSPRVPVTLPSLPHPCHSSKVLPPVLKLAPKQAAYFFLAGYDGVSFHPSFAPPAFAPKPAAAALAAAAGGKGALALATKLAEQLEATSTPAYLVNVSEGGCSRLSSIHSCMSSLPHVMPVIPPPCDACHPSPM
ncbi:unnamed protein product [Closterium sp. Naga37s-1]|nr:unnamed protein product [Closterium sp. Naga37s-1]